MQIDRVTITGADDSTNIKWMLDTSQKYPFVEWGILVSLNAGGPRFPSKDWLDRLNYVAAKNPMQLSLHVCGQWVKDICAGHWEYLMHHEEATMALCRRVQLNFHGHKHVLYDRFYETAREMTSALGKEIIFQVDGTNDDLVDKARARGLDAVPLFDLSGGAGVVSENWPLKDPEIYSGYAGGLGPDNVIAEMEKISQVAKHGRTWIDMETKVRTSSNRSLDYQAVEIVLNQVEQSGYLGQIEERKNGE